MAAASDGRPAWRPPSSLWWCEDQSEAFAGGLPRSQRTPLLPGSLLHLCLRIIRISHDAPIAGHPGRDMTYELLSRKNFWLLMRKDVERYATLARGSSHAATPRMVPSSRSQSQIAPGRIYPWTLWLDFRNPTVSMLFRSWWIGYLSRDTSFRALPPSPPRDLPRTSWTTSSNFMAFQTPSSPTADRGSLHASGPIFVTVWE